MAIIKSINVVRYISAYVLEYDVGMTRIVISALMDGRWGSSIAHGRKVPFRRVVRDFMGFKR